MFAEYLKERHGHKSDTKIQKTVLFIDYSYCIGILEIYISDILQILLPH